MEAIDSHITAKNRFFIEGVERWAQERGATCERYFGDWLVTLTYQGKMKHLEWYDIGINSSTNYLIAKDKTATSWLVKKAGVPAVEHMLALRPDSQGWTPEQDKAIDAFVARVGFPLVIKPNTGTNGGDVYKVDDRASLDAHLAQLFVTERAIALSPFVRVVKEFRATVLDGEVLLMYEKHQDNRHDFRFNLSHGATVHDVTPEDQARVAPIASAALAALGARFANVDVVMSDAGELSVLEINGGVAFEKYALTSPEHKEKAYAAYARALDRLFS